MHNLKRGVGIQISGAPNRAVSLFEKSPNKNRPGVWVSGIPVCGRVTAGEPAGGAADRAAPASMPSGIADTGTARERALETRGDLLFCQPHPASSRSTSTWGEEQGRVGALLGGAGVLEYSGALPQTENPALATPGGSQAEFKAHLNAPRVLCFPSQPSKSPRPGAAEPHRMTPHTEP